MMKINKRLVFLIVIAIKTTLVLVYFFGDDTMRISHLAENGLIKLFTDNSSLNSSMDSPFKVIYLKSKCECKNEETLSINKYRKHFAVTLSNLKYNSIQNVFNMSYDEFADSNITCGVYKQFRRGLSQKVFGFSLYGKNKFYYDKLKTVSSQLKRLYPGWLMRVYHDESINKSVICDLECATDEFGDLVDNIDFCNIEYDIRLKPLYFESIDDSILDLSYAHAMKWRWFPVGDSFVSIFASRDSDSFVLQREVDSVNVWLNSSNVAHIMRGKVID